MKRSLLALLATAVTIFAFVSCDNGGEEQGKEPGAAGNINQADPAEDNSVLLTIGEIQYAETYRWYRDDEQVQNTASREYRATVSGKYKVAGVNSYGEGAASPGKVITIENGSQDVSPGEAGEITAADPAEDNSVLLTIGEIKYAETYRWYRDDEQIQNTASREYRATVSGTYKVAGVNSHGEGTASPDKVIIIEGGAPGGAGEITAADPADDRSVLLSIPEIKNAETYRWYRDDEQIQNTDSREYRATISGTYKVAGVNSHGEGTASPDKIVTIKLVLTDFERSTYVAYCTPRYNEENGGEIGPSTFNGMSGPASFPDETGDGMIEFLLFTGWGGIPDAVVNVDLNDGKLYIDNETTMYREEDTIKGYFDAIYKNTDDGKFYIMKSFSPEYNKADKTLDFSGSYNGYPLWVGIICYYVENGRIAKTYGDAYENCILHLTPMPGAPALRSTGVMKGKAGDGSSAFRDFEGLEFGGYVDFDPSKFSRNN